MCGVFGFSGKKNHSANILKLKMLGMFNRDRGKDSCGYYYSGKIAKGVDEFGIHGKKEADFADFIAYNDLEKGKLKDDLFIGHTRKSTSGAHTENNAHPFKINDYIQVHNGQIVNIKELTEKYKVNDFFTVDSKGLAILIEREGWKVLEEYLGWAALAMTWETNPNALYLYHGASKDKPGSKNWIERPLFFLRQPEGIYFSSTEESLSAISENNSIAEILPCNVVYEIIDGEFTDFEFKIDRWDMNIKPEPEPKPEPKTEPKTVESIVREVPFNKSRINLPESSALTDDNLNDIVREDSFEKNADLNKILIKHARYYFNGILLNGAYLIDKNGYLIKENTTFENMSDTYYFIHGIMMLSRYKYEDAYRLKISQHSNVGSILSKYSKYPVFCLEDEAKNHSAKYRNKWYHDGNVVIHRKAMLPIFSLKEYVIETGKTTSINSL